MKPFVLFFLFVSTLFTANAQTFTDAVKYNDYIVNQQNLIGEKILSFVEKFSEENMTKEVITLSLEDLLSTAKAGVSAIKQLGAFEGEIQLKQASLELFQFYVKTIDRDYREMVSLIYESEMDDVAVARLNAVVEKVQADEALYDGNFSEAQIAFAEKHNIVLEENELQDDIDKN